PAGRPLPQDRGEASADALRARFRSAAASPPENPASASVRASMPSMARPGIQAWWISSSVPQTARIPPMKRAAASGERGGSGQPIAKKSRYPSTPYRIAWTNLSKSGIHDTAGTDGGDGQDV